MYKIIKISGLITMLLLLFSISCNRDLIDLQPSNETEASYFKKETEFTKAIVGIYAKLTDFYNYNARDGRSTLMQVTFLPGDDITTTADDPFEHFAGLQASNGKLGNYYKSSYELITRSNIVLDKIEAENGVYSTPNLKNYHKGEALFLRGLMFYNLWNYFGKPPIILKRLTSSEDWTNPESQGTQMLDQAIADFTEAVSLLPDAWPASDLGRATKNSANGMLGKSLVVRGSHTNTPADYTAALSAFNALSGLALVPEFDDNNSAFSENNAESLFEFQASQSPGDNIWLPNEFDAAIGTISSFWGYYDNHWSLFGASPHIGTQKLADAFEADDPRRDRTLDVASKAIRKYVTHNQFAPNGAGSVNNPRILRYADVLLLKAEAVLQSGGSTADAIGLINEVRKRARDMVSGGTVPADYTTAETDKATIMNWIMNERLLELAGEGQRWIDLKRWHVAGYITLNNAFFSPANTQAMSFQAPKHLLMPIPIDEIDKNPNVTQNPDY
jgi:hypothetical protein